MLYVVQPFSLSQYDEGKTVWRQDAKEMQEQLPIKFIVKILIRCGAGRTIRKSTILLLLTRSGSNRLVFQCDLLKHVISPDYDVGMYIVCPTVVYSISC